MIFYSCMERGNGVIGQATDDWSVMSAAQSARYGQGGADFNR
jgi:hypothetical protein